MAEFCLGVRLAFLTSSDLRGLMKSSRWRKQGSQGGFICDSHTRVRSMDIDRGPRIVLVGKWQGA